MAMVLFQQRNEQLRVPHAKAVPLPIADESYYLRERHSRFGKFLLHDHRLRDRSLIRRHLTVFSAILLSSSGLSGGALSWCIRLILR